MKKRKTCHKTQKRRKHRGGNCGCNNTNSLLGVPVIHGGKSRKSRKYQRTQTPYYPRKKKYMRGHNPLLGSSYNTVSSFGTTSGIPFSSNTLFGITNHPPSNGADISFFGKHNTPLV
jgi:hypothetical protein